MIPFPFQAGQLGIDNAERDPYFSSVVFLANFDSSISDVKGKTITVTGTPAVNSTIPFAGGKSCYFDGTSASLTLADSADWTFNVPFTYELWVHRIPGGDTTTGLIDFGGVSNNNFQSSNVWIDPSNNLVTAACTSALGPANIFNSVTVGSAPNSTWNHVAISWDGSTYRAFANGTLGPTTSSSTPTYDPNFGVLFGAYPDTTWNSNLAARLKGALGPVRITKGVCRYVASFTPTQAPFPTR